MSITAVAPQPIAATELVRADQVRVGDTIGADGGQVVTKVLVAGDVTSIASFSEHGPHISEDRSDRLIRIRERAEAATAEPCANCATTPCVFCRANELLIGYGITDVIITRSL